MADLTKDSLPWDKLMHIVIGAAGSALLIGFLQELGMWNFAIMVAIGAFKEIVWDKLLAKGTPEFWDFIATCLGISFVMVGYLIGLNS